MRHSVTDQSDLASWMTSTPRKKPQPLKTKTKSRQNVPKLNAK
ncbi:hypothetical protein BN873_950075 [Candidatus Competibacter denitrificans Run_A_D11]|uniref:Uncharacterized protein n=1 Tax=Candidatus Competibacter denitrificans Run_A_D11 TaxID=1400863 RepID=W6M9R9_9GAMM|nr:hypothetical protein BN873_950075 [Candidatus Competibacter denitrificans Run_A_D11]